MESLVDVSNSNYKKQLEYLFYGVDPLAPREIFHVMEEGFRSYNVNIKIWRKGMQIIRNLRFYPFSQ